MIVTVIACLFAYENDSVNREKQLMQEEWGEITGAMSLELVNGVGSSAQVEELALDRNTDVSARETMGEDRVQAHDAGARGGVEVPACGGFPDWVFSGKYATRSRSSAKSKPGEGGIRGLRNKKIWNTHLGDGRGCNY